MPKPCHHSIATQEEGEARDYGRIVRAAFAQLPDHDWARLRKFAQIFALPSSDGEDLLHEAVLKTLTGSRPWDQRVSLTQHLIGAIRSIAWNERKKSYRIESLGEHDGNVVAADMAADRELIARETLARLREVLQNAAQVQSGRLIDAEVLDLLECGMGPMEIQEALGISKTRCKRSLSRIRKAANTLGVSNALKALISHSTVAGRSLLLTTDVGTVRTVYYHPDTVEVSPTLSLDKITWSDFGWGCGLDSVTSAVKRLDRVREALADHILSLSDDELAEELLEEDGVTVEDSAAPTRQRCLTGLDLTTRGPLNARKTTHSPRIGGTP